MLKTLIPGGFAVVAGASIVVQQVLNANLRLALRSAAWSGFVSYLGGLVFMALLAAVLRDPLPTGIAVSRIPWWAWSGGLFGAIFIALGILLVPRLGAATFIVLLVAGQMLASVSIDHFGWFGLARHALDPPRAAGVFLLIVAVALIRH